MPSPSFKNTLRYEFLNIYSVLSIALISFLYFSITVLLLNLRLITGVIFGNYSLLFKSSLLSALIFGSEAPLGNLNFTLLVITSILVAANIVAVFKNIKKLKKSGGTLTISVGGSALIGIFVAGCSSCGFSVFALLGLTAAVSLFPFEGLLIGILIIALLVLSLIYSLRTLHKEVYCKIK